MLNDSTKYSVTGAVKDAERKIHGYTFDDPGDMRIRCLSGNQANLIACFIDNDQIKLLDDNEVIHVLPYLTLYSVLHALAVSGKLKNNKSYRCVDFAGQYLGDVVFEGQTDVVSTLAGSGKQSQLSFTFKRNVPIEDVVFNIFCDL